MKFNNDHFIFLFIIFFINIVAHFLPFERSALSPDDYSLLFKEKAGLYNFIWSPHYRPIAYIWIEFQTMIVGDNSQIGFIFTFTSSLLTIFASYIPHLASFTFIPLSTASKTNRNIIIKM